MKLKISSKYIELAIVLFLSEFFIALFGLDKYPLANMIIGTSFAWIDMLVYTLGSITVLIGERRITG